MEDLEFEINSITDKVSKYQSETDEIIAQLRERIQERELENERIQSEPALYYTDHTLNIHLDDQQASSSELLDKAKDGVNNKMKSFLDATSGDVKAWKNAASKEILAFTKFLEAKHNQLISQFTNELAEFTPVLSKRFDA